ncbi:DNA-formamidopyrimidine glycosylase family protein, partial [Microbacterium testaceum]
MPEGDTVYRAAAKLSAALTGKVVTRFDIRVPGSATADLRGEPVHGVAARGKHLLHRIGGYTLHSHLQME